MRHIDPQPLIDELTKEVSLCLNKLALLDPVANPTELARTQARYAEKQAMIEKLRKLAE
ncbi:hypothetical protein [Deefgea sp. CFH1-16]|uniref:hypothetical protein n=1 Tax=Deefgea sp. CFH1-16 TaxID=2675457 RepID=UPI0015F537F7|nr:hypothetical protein [Deefgea sp. CFH1-16]MBM5575825.1 hypothetical protein [Deefgea sp. CFH1-16]